MPPNSYDPDADAVYMSFGDARIVESEEVSPNVVLDFDANDRVVGIEVLHTSKTLAPGAWTTWPLPGAETDPHAHAAE
jgi:uncharacterized protein YuzE